MKIDLTKKEDITGISEILDRTELFPSELLSGMVDPFFSGAEDAGVWLTVKDKSTVLGFCYAIPEKLTNGSWNMVAIAVSPNSQKSGIGSKIVSALEEFLSKNGGRIIIVDTSGTEAYLKTREFYKKNGYMEVACIPDFWDSGDDKITLVKSLKI